MWNDYFRISVCCLGPTLFGKIHNHYRQLWLQVVNSAGRRRKILYVIKKCYCGWVAIIHSETEKRFYALGRTDSKRALFIAFTIRNNLVRVISARDMSSREREVYNNEQANT
jgi:hypothetical protein